MCVLGWIVKSESLYNVLVCMHLQAGVCVDVCVWLTLLTLCFGMLYTHALMDFNETWVQ